jgi:hypothetical protein
MPPTVCALTLQSEGVITSGYGGEQLGVHRAHQRVGMSVHESPIGFLGPEDEGDAQRPILRR